MVAAGWRRPPLLVGLDVTYHATLSPTELAVLAARGNPAAAFCDGPVRAYQQRGSVLVPDGTCPCHDLVAMMAAADPTLLDGPVVDLAIDTSGGPAWGATVADLRQPLLASRGLGVRTGTPWQVALEVDVARFRLAVRRLFGD